MERGTRADPTPDGAGGAVRGCSTRLGAMTSTLILLRHGESEWNAKNLFTGWVDVDLNAKGEAEAQRGGELLVEAGLLPDVVHTSLLKRAIRTAQIALIDGRASLDPDAALVAAERAPLRRAAGQGQGGDARRVRRGAVHGLAPLATTCRRPRSDATTRTRTSTTRATRACRRTRGPATECLKDVLLRALPVLVRRDRAGPAGRQGHAGRRARQLAARDRQAPRPIGDAEVVSLNIPTGIPLVYELDDDLRPTGPGRYLDPEAAAASIEAVKNQGKK